MGIEILSFTIKDVYDEVQYLASLGKAQTAAVKRDADIGVAQANRDAGIREAECEKTAMDVKYTTDTKIEDNARMFKLQKANFDREVNTAKAEAQLAYELQAAKIRQKIRNEEIQIEVVERRKQIEVESQEVERKERELNATVRLPAEAESYKVQAIAEGKRTQTVEVARAEAERIKKIGSAEAYAIEGVGKAEAERMRMKAAVYKQYGEAAIMSLVLEALPKIAAEVSAPLAKTEEIVLLGGEDRGTAEVTRLVSQVPPAVQALTGVDLSKVVVGYVIPYIIARSVLFNASDLHITAITCIAISKIQIFLFNDSFNTKMTHNNALSAKNFVINLFGFSLVINNL
ncbi:uncharacterized protein GBIM_07232 [Gryllus bimaculatus]|nr:uncharacterized protein GBIM_07232 [Gryllus bimaculatus]